MDPKKPAVHHPDEQSTHAEEMAHTPLAAGASTVQRAPKKPMIGMIVHWRNEESVLMAGIITHVHTDICVHLTVFPDVNEPVSRSSVMFGDGPREWTWMPRA